MKNIYDLYLKLILKPGYFFIELTRSKNKVKYGFIIILLYLFLSLIINFILMKIGYKYYLINFFSAEYYGFICMLNVLCHLFILMLSGTIVYLSGKIFFGIGGFDDSFAVTAHSLAIPGFFYILMKIIVYFIVSGLFGNKDQWSISLMMNLSRILTVILQLALLTLGVKMSHIIKVLPAFVISLTAMAVYQLLSLIFFI